MVKAMELDKIGVGFIAFLHQKEGVFHQVELIVENPNIAVHIRSFADLPQGLAHVAVQAVQGTHIGLNLRRRG